MQCPANKKTGKYTGYDGANNYLGYQMNYHTIRQVSRGLGKYQFLKIRSLDVPSRYVLFLDRYGSLRRVNYTDTLLKWNLNDCSKLDGWHMKNLNYLFADGAIKGFTYPQVWAHFIGYSNIPWQSGNPNTLFDKKNMFDPRIPTTAYSN
jgi:prepilin-type processing-associated H-X9-DG protein